MANEPMVHLSDSRDFIATLSLEAITQNACGRNAGSNLGDTRRTSRFSPHDEMGLFIGFCRRRGPTRTPSKSQLVKGLGQRFESARRLFVFPANHAKTKTSRVLIGGSVSSRLARGKGIGS